MKNNIPVLIIGAGPCGLAAAAFLTHYGIQCRIIDKKTGPTKTSNAVGVHARTLELLEEIDLSRKLLASGLAIQHAKIFVDKKSLLDLDLSLIPSRYNFICNIPQNETERHLIDYLSENSLPVEYQTEALSFEQHEDRVFVNLKDEKGATETVTASWIIAADGYHSLFRETLNIPYEGKEFKYAFMMIDAPTEIANPDYKKNLLMSSGNQITAMLFPMQKSTRIIIETSHCPEYKNANISSKLFNDILAQMFPFEIQVGSALWQSHFYVHERLASTYRNQRIFLAGDAAHVHIPAGGQGMNTGIQDAINLSWKLAQVIKGKANELLLDTYESERKPIAEGVLAMSGDLANMMLKQNFILKYLRQHILPKIMQLKPLQEKFAAKMSQITVNYARQSSVAKFNKQFIPGHRFINMPLNPLFDDFLILDFNNDLTRKDLQNIPAKIHCVSNLEKSKYFPNVKSGYCIIRPDRYIAFFAPNKNDLQKFLN